MPAAPARMAVIALCASLLAISLAGCGSSQEELDQAREQAAEQQKLKDKAAELEDEIKQLKEQQPQVTTTVTQGQTTTQAQGPSRNCGGGVAAGPNTSCAFALNTAKEWVDTSGGTTIQVYSPATKKTYTMNCSTNAAGTTCRGGQRRDRLHPVSVATDPIKVEVWSDVACPWCYIGKRNLDTATEAFARRHPQTPVEVEYRSFELQPDAPDSYDGTIADYLAEKRGLNAEQAAAMLERPREAATQAGIEMDFESLKPAGTGRAHRLLHLAADRGSQVELNELLFRANFEEGRSLGDRDALADLAVAAGLDREEAIEAVESDAYLSRVEEDKARAAEYGIGGVPFFVVAGRFGIAGAQPPEALLQALEQVWAEQEPNES